MSRQVSDRPPGLIKGNRGIGSEVAFRWFLAAFLASVVICMNIWPQGTETLLRRCYPLVPLLFAIALFYWLFLTPSVLGFLALLLVMLLAMVIPWNWAIGEVSQSLGDRRV